MVEMKLQLAQLESRLQALIEGSAARLFPLTQKQPDLAFLLAEAMRQEIWTAPGGENIGPNLFTIEANPQHADALSSNQALLESLTQILREQGEEAGIQFSGPLSIRVMSDEVLTPGEICIQAQHSQAELSKTTTMEVETTEPAESQQPPPNAFLIVDGMQVFPLTQAVINIGRRADNDLMIDQEGVSRVHAQLRLVRGCYMIFDLDSKGGTWLNGNRIRQSALRAGDVVSLSGVPLVFGQDPIETEDTQQYETGL